MVQKNISLNVKNKNIKHNVILFYSTLTINRRCDGEWLIIFAVFELSVIARRR